MRLKKFVAIAMASVMMFSSVCVWNHSYDAKALTDGTTSYGTFGNLTTDKVSEYKDGTQGIIADESTVRGNGTGSVLQSENWSVGKGSITEVENFEIEIPYDSSLAEKFNIPSEKTVQPEDIVKVIIVLKDESIVESTGSADLNFFTKMKAAVLEKKQNSVINKIEKNVLEGQSVDVSYQYTLLVNGIAASVPYGSIEEIKALPEVEKVLLQPVYTVSETKDADIQTAYSGMMIGRQETWSTGYTGKGMKIAIVDTGIDDDHPSFSALAEEALTEDSLTQEGIEAVLSQLNAIKKMPKVTSEQLYLNTKIAYGFNYIDENTRINHKYDQQGDHGTHVAGIAAANKLDTTSVVGVAPDAQLMVMKVFGANGGAYSEDIIAALEDAMILGADVVNMSLGSSGGFATAEGEMNEIFSRVSETDTILAVSAGNSGSSGSGNQWNQMLNIPYNLTGNPDNALVSWPSTYKSAMCVASIENIVLQGIHFFEAEGSRFPYNDAQNGINALLTSLAGQEFEYVMVDNLGQTAEDFAGVEGKIAVVSRGISTFRSKTELAEAAGAVAIIIYNTSNGLMTMDMSDSNATIPSVLVPLSAGEALMNIKAENPEAKIYISGESGDVPSPDAYLMSEFSAWGSAPDLSIKPEITAPGGNIFSCYDNGKYGSMSGTSMASPNVAGLATLVKQYVKETYPDMTAKDVQVLVNALIMSTATPVDHPNGLKYSPRLQGAGLANAYNAIKSQAVLEVEGSDRPKVEFYDDPEKTGVYNFSYNVKNFGTDKLYFDYNGTAFTESVDETYAEYGLLFMSEQPYELGASMNFVSDAEVLKFDYTSDEKTTSSDARALYLALKNNELAEKSDAFRYELTADEAVNEADIQAYLDALVDKGEVDLEETVVEVEAGETAKVSVTLALTDDDKNYMDTYFENGIYVEGFAGLTALNTEGVDLSLPYLGFYGDWTQAPILDSGYYWEDDEEIVYNQYANILWSNWGGEASRMLIGYNPYFDEPFIKEFLSVSPNEDGYADYVDDVYISLLRNAKTITFTYENAETGEVYSSQVAEEAAKTYYVPSYGVNVPFILSWYYEDGFDSYKFTDAEGKALADGTKVKLTIDLTLEYDKHESANLSDTWEVEFTVDNTAPVLTDAVFVEEDGRHYVDLTFSDHVGVAGVHFVDASGAMVIASELPNHAKSGESMTQRFDVTGYGDRFAVILGDYACNERTYFVETEGNAPQLDESLIYAYRTFDIDMMNDSVYAWVSIDPTTGEIVAQNSEIYMDYAINAATYASGYIFAAAADGNLYAIVPGLWNSRVKIAELGYTLKELAYNPVNQKLYGYTTKNYAIVEIDPLTGESKEVKTYAPAIHGMAFDNEGTMYCVETMTALVTYDTTTWTRTSLGSLGQTAGITYLQYIQTMTYDAANDCLYWMAFDTATGKPSQLVKIDLSGEEIAATKVAALGNNAEIVGAFMLGDNTLEIPEVSVDSLEISDEEITMLPLRKKSLSVNMYPWYGVNDGIDWTSSDESVATVTPTGVVSAVGVGECIITASTNDGELSVDCAVKVVSVETELNAFVYMGGATTWTWANFNANDVKGSATFTQSGAVQYRSGEYANGYIYAYDERGEFFRLDPETHVAQKVAGATDAYIIKDMAYDHKTGIMYGLGMNTTNGGTSIYTIDLISGAATRIASVKDEFNYAITTLSASAEAGVLYMISKPGFLCKFDVETKTVTNIALMDYSSSDILQSMTYDYESNSIFWSMVTAAGETSVVYVDPTNGSASALGSFDNGAQLTCMYVEPGTPMERPEVPVESVSVTGKLAMISGTSMGLPVAIKPINTTDVGTWTSSDESVAIVDDGIVIAVGSGNCIISGTVGTKSAEVEVQVYYSAGDIYGNILMDLASGYSGVIGMINDADLSAGSVVSPNLGIEIYAGEYFDGKYYTYGINDTTYERGFYVFDVENEFQLVESHIGNFPDMRDMAFDYTTGTMYAIGARLNVEGDYPALYTIDIKTGNAFKVSEEEMFCNWFGLACANDGTLYAVDDYGDIYEVDKESGNPAGWMPVVSTGLGANVYQSMFCDHNTGNIYWNQVYNYGDKQDTTFLLIDVENETYVDLGVVGARGTEMTGMFTIPQEEIEIPVPETTGVVFAKNNGMVSVGGTLQLSAITLPMSVLGSGAVTYESSDETIATVDETGLVTGLADGTVTITATANGYTATTKVYVLGEKSQMIIGNSNGLQQSPILDPNDISDLTDFEAQYNLVTTTYHTDGYFYGTDFDGYLYRFTMDGKTFERISDVPFLYAYNYENLDGVFDLVSNPYDGNLYVSYAVMDWSNYTAKCYIGMVDVENEQVVDPVYLGWSVQAPCEFVFTSEREIVLIDYYETVVFTMNFDEDYAAQPAIYGFSYAINFDSDGKIGMAYNQEMDKIFVGNYDPYYGGGMNLYMLDLEGAAIEKLGKAGYGDTFIDIMFLNGVEPAKTVE